MEITSNLKNNLFKCFNEARGVAINRHKILKTKKLNKLNYYEFILLMLIFTMIISTILLINNFLIASFTLYGLTLFTLILNISTYISMYRYRKKLNFQNTILINEEGITDTSFMGIKMIFNWSKILGLVIKKNTLVILTDTYVYFYFPLESKPQIMSALKKYQKNLPLIA